MYLFTAMTTVMSRAHLSVRLHAIQLLGEPCSAVLRVSTSSDIQAARTLQFWSHGDVRGFFETSVAEEPQRSYKAYLLRLTTSWSEAGVSSLAWKFRSIVGLCLSLGRLPLRDGTASLVRELGTLRTSVALSFRKACPAIEQGNSPGS